MLPPRWHKLPNRIRFRSRPKSVSSAASAARPVNMARASSCTLHSVVLALLPHSLCQRAMLKKLNKKEAKAIVDRLTVPSCPSLKKEHVQEATEVLGRVLVRAAKQRSTLRSSTAHSRAARQHRTARGASSARSTPRGAPRRGPPASALTSSSSSSSLRCLLSHAGVPR